MFRSSPPRRTIRVAVSPESGYFHLAQLLDGGQRRPIEGQEHIVYLQPARPALLFSSKAATRRLPPLKSTVKPMAGCPAMSQSATSLHLLHGMAKPSPSTVLSWATTFSVVMPTTCPRSLMRAPPEFPKLMGALVWIT